jgi:hypothetical protein
LYLPAIDNLFSVIITMSSSELQMAASIDHGPEVLKDHGPEVLQSGLEVDHTALPGLSIKQDSEPYGESAGEPLQQTQPGGIGKWTLAGIAVLLTAIIMGSTLGGGLGSALSNCKRAKQYVLPGGS